MTNYSQIGELRLFYLEDSWVLDIVARPGTLTISLDVVLLPEHPDYQAPLPGESHCYRRGELRFEKVSVLHWAGQGLPPARDASGELDYGGVDSFDFDHDAYRIAGDFGEINVRADSLQIELVPLESG
ncbi:hypothetical protein Ade02nite_01010 [Paractinoplanes deccanensis]|uniref:Uncharacterized protein n=1 Tax=Paractinoplanes deccanensis TaxID=113561 RepID=A0ABQ3XUU0_9ACTN|nr:hypothetical protein [Actinoplanes deccanensis]GID71460.1 hypothetical protein Ade02nite_01010 [Actinoplanes deccanensis]